VVGHNSNKRNKISGLSLIEALVATVIVGIGFIAVFQMVNYSVISVDISGERTKSNYLTTMVAEDLISDSNTNIEVAGVNRKFYLRLADEGGWEMPTCEQKHQFRATAGNHVLDSKRNKWREHFSSTRVKCKSNNDIKRLTIIDICRVGFAPGGGNCNYINTDIFDPKYFGRMEVNLNDGAKRKYIYFQIK